MPHVPNPLGSYPMVLRDYQTDNPRLGELLLDYTKYDLYYVNRQTGNLVSVAQDIYNRILIARMQNTSFVIADADKQSPVPPSNQIWPPISDRAYNTFYYVIRSRAVNEVIEIEEDEEEETP